MHIYMYMPNHILAQHAHLHIRDPTHAEYIHAHTHMHACTHTHACSNIPILSQSAMDEHAGFV